MILYLSTTRVLILLAVFLFCDIIITSLYLQYVQNNKAADNDWFRLESNKDGTRWFGKCWFIHNLLKYEFDVEFDVSINSDDIILDLA